MFNSQYQNQTMHETLNSIFYINSIWKHIHFYITFAIVWTSVPNAECRNRLFTILFLFCSVFLFSFSLSFNRRVPYFFQCCSYSTLCWLSHCELWKDVQRNAKNCGIKRKHRKNWKRKNNQNDFEWNTEFPGLLDTFVIHFYECYICIAK